MAFKKIEQASAIDLKAGGKGSEVQGIYLGFKEISTSFGEQFIYRFKQKDGSVQGVYGFTNLNIGMENIAVGAMVKLVYQGKKKVDTKYGKQQDVHQVDILIDADASEEIEVEDESMEAL